MATSQAAQKLCSQRFYYCGLLRLLLFLSVSRLYCIKKFPYSSFMQQNSTRSTSVKEIGFFQTLPGSPGSGGAGWESNNSCESWGPGDSSSQHSVGPGGHRPPQQLHSAQTESNNCHDFTGVHPAGLCISTVRTRFVC